MKILVIDDTQKHLDAAIQTLIGHDVTICNNYDEAVDLVRDDGWDAILCDLLMPAGERSQGERGEKFIGQEMPVGWALALMAAHMHHGAKYIAVFSDINHHDHPASAMLDYMQKPFEINGKRVVFTNNTNFMDPGPNGGTKNWGKVLEKLLEKRR